MREGKNREVKNVLGHLGLAVNRLIRVSFGPFQLGDLPEGAVDEVRTRHLREQLGERVAAAAGLDFAGPIEDQARQSAARAPTSPGASLRRECQASDGGPDRAQVAPRSHQRRVGNSRPAWPRSFEGREKARPPQDDGKRRSAASAAEQEEAPPPRARPARRAGAARRERKHGRRPFRGKPR